MVRSVTLARIHDGLPLTASTDDDDLQRDFPEFKATLKSILQTLSSQTEQMCSIEASGLNINILNSSGVSYICVSDKTYPKRLAFGFLEELQRAFELEYPAYQVEAVARPYAFMKFDSTIQKIKRSYQDVRAKQNLSRLQEELLDVSQIMTTNIKQVLERGNKLENMSLMSDTLAAESRRYVRDARQLNIDALYRKYGAPTIVLAAVFFFLYIWFKWF